MPNRWASCLLPPTTAQRAVLCRIHWWAYDFCASALSMPQISWQQQLGARELSYTGEVVHRAVSIEAEAVLLGLPPPDLSGRISGLELAA